MSDINAAISELFRKDRVAIRKIICEYETDYDIVDELMMDTFTKAWEKRESYNEKSSLLTWVCSIAKNVVKDYIKSKRGSPDLVSEDVLRVADSDGYTDTLVAANPQDDPAAAVEAEDTLNVALSTMPERMAAVVTMRLEGHSNEEIAKIMMCSVGRVYGYISESRGYFT